ncbi:MAG: peptidylprolyl isomerase [bacterium]|nr:MAG: peptidylprolyl isomerase [bacterium]
MSKRYLIALSIMILIVVGCSESVQTINPVVELTTTMGTIKVELYIEEAPVSVTNFMEYVESSFYDSTIIHRVIPDFIIQGGQHKIDLTKKETNSPIVCESDNGLLNLCGTIAVARGAEPNSGTSQYFINLVDNPALNKINDTYAFGYAVFGHVIEGMNVVDAIASVPTSTQQTPDEITMKDVPITPVIVLSARCIEYERWVFYEDR